MNQLFRQLPAIFCIASSTYNRYDPGSIQIGIASIIQQYGRIITIQQALWISSIRQKQWLYTVLLYKLHFSFHAGKIAEAVNTSCTNISYALCFFEGSFASMEHCFSVSIFINKYARLYTTYMRNKRKCYLIKQVILHSRKVVYTFPVDWWFPTFFYWLTTLNSVLLFCALPSSVALSATGLVAPNPS